MTNATTDPNEDPITAAARAGAAYALLATKTAVRAGIPTTLIIPGMIRLGIDGDLERFAAIAEVMMEVAFAELSGSSDAVSMIGSIKDEIAGETPEGTEPSAHDVAEIAFRHITGSMSLDRDSALFVIVAGIAAMSIALRLGSQQDVCEMVLAEIDRLYAMAA